MRAKEIQASFHICEGCDKAEVGYGDAPVPKKIRHGEVEIIEGWRDEDDDWVGNKEDLPTIEEAVEQSYYDDEDKIFEASYLQCPTRNHDSDDGWEIEAFSKIYVCGVCNTRYTSLNPAAVCCIEKEND